MSSTNERGSIAERSIEAVTTWQMGVLIIKGTYRLDRLLAGDQLEHLTLGMLENGVDHGEHFLEKLVILKSFSCCFTDLCPGFVS